jgi:hypothetical protein
MKRGYTRIIAAVAGSVLAVPLLLVGSPAAGQSTPPAVPAGLQVSDLGPHHVTATWEPVSGASRYEVEEKRSSGQLRSVTVEEPVTTFFLDQRTSGQLRVRAGGTGSQWSDWTDPVTFRTPRDRNHPGPVPTDLRVIESDPVAVTVGWDPPTSGPGGLTYLVQVTEVGAACCATLLEADEASIALHLDRDKTYSVRVDAQDAVGMRSGYSEPLEFVTPAAPPLNAPGNVEVSTEPGKAVVTWDASTSPLGVKDYQVRLDHSTGPKSVTTSQRTAEFLVPDGGEVEVTVRARDTAGRWSEHSSPVIVMVPEAEGWDELGAPRNLRLIFNDAGVVERLEWDPASGGDGNLTYSFNYRFGSQSNFDVFFTTSQTFVDILSEIGPFVECTPASHPGDTFIVRIQAHAQGQVSPPSEEVAMCF